MPAVVETCGIAVTDFIFLFVSVRLMDTPTAFAYILLDPNLR